MVKPEITGLDYFLKMLEDDVRSAKETYFPRDPKRRRDAILYLARYVGHDLASYDEIEARRAIPILYKRLIIRNSRDDVGPVVSREEFASAVEKGMEEATRLRASVSRLAEDVSKRKRAYRRKKILVYGLFMVACDAILVAGSWGEVSPSRLILAFFLVFCAVFTGYQIDRMFGKE